jgi:hypothetical protein
MGYLNIRTTPSLLNFEGSKFLKFFAPVTTQK